MTFRITRLGSSAAQPSVKRHHAAHALNVHEQFYLVDCGEGTQSRLLEAGINPLKINAVFISHLHGDHVYGLFPLISTLGLMGRKTPLEVFAPRPFDEITEQHFRYFDCGLEFEVQYHPVDTRKHQLLYENKVMEVWSVPLRHRIPTSGYLFREKTPPLNVHKEAITRYGLSIAQIVAAKRGERILLDDGTELAPEELTYRPYEPRSYAYLSDTLYSAKAAGLVRGVDLLYHEATFAHTDRALARQTGHSTAQQAAKAAIAAEAKRLLIGHFSGRYKDITPLTEEARLLFPQTEAVIEGQAYDIAVKSSIPHATFHP